MQRFLLACILAMCAALPCFAQATITGQIVSTDSQSWNNGTYTISFVPAPNHPSGYYFNGVPFNPGTYTGNLDGSGNFPGGLTVPQNTSITPSLSQWNFQVCPQSSMSNCYSTKITVTGASMNVTSLIVPPPIVVSAYNYPRLIAYQDSEIQGGRLGHLYWNPTTQNLRVCFIEPCGWENIGGGGGSGPTIQVNGVNTSSQSLLNFVNTGSVTFSNPSGGIVNATASGSGSGGACPPGNVAIASDEFCASPASVSGSNSSFVNGKTFTVAGSNTSITELLPWPTNSGDTLLISSRCQSSASITPTYSDSIGNSGTSLFNATGGSTGTTGYGKIALTTGGSDSVTVSWAGTGGACTNSFGQGSQYLSLTVLEYTGTLALDQHTTGGPSNPWSGAGPVTWTNAVTTTGTNELLVSFAGSVGGGATGGTDYPGTLAFTEPTLRIQYPPDLPTQTSTGNNSLTGDLGGAAAATYTVHYSATNCAVFCNSGSALLSFTVTGSGPAGIPTFRKPYINLADPQSVVGFLSHANIAPTAVTPGSYTNANITVAQDGSITAAANGSGTSGVTSLNTLTGPLSLVQGAGINITPSGSNITITNTGTGTINAAAQYSLGYYSAAGSAFTISGSAPPSDSQLYYCTDTTGQAPGCTSLAGLGQRVVSGTTDTLLSADRGQVVTYTSASAVAVAVPQAGSTGFGSKWMTSIDVQGAGTVTLTPVTSTCNGASTCSLSEGMHGTLISDNTNYILLTSMGTLTAGSGVTITPSSFGATLSAAGSGGTVTSVTAGTGLSGGTITTTGTIAVANNGITATQLASQYSAYLQCNSRGLGDGLNAIPAGTYLQTTCYNNSGVTMTITGIKCFTDNSGSSTLNATDNAANALLTGAITCSSSYASGTVSGTHFTISSGGYIKFTFVADGTSKQTDWVVIGTY